MKRFLTLALALIICLTGRAAISQQENFLILIPGENGAATAKLEDFVEATAASRLGLPPKDTLGSAASGGVSVFRGNSALDGFAAIELGTDRFLLDQRLVDSSPNGRLPANRGEALNLLGLAGYEEFLFSPGNRTKLERLASLAGENRPFLWVEGNVALSVRQIGDVFMITGTGGEVGELPGVTLEVSDYFELGLSPTDGSGVVCGDNTAEPWTHCTLYAVKLAVDSETICSGTMLSPHHVLTAAHCVCDGLDGQLPDSFRVVLGQGRIGRKIQPRSAEPVSIYPGLNGGACNHNLVPKERQRNGDLAIIHLPEGAFKAALDALTETMPSSAADEERDLALAAVGQTEEADWELAPPNRFAVVGFGRGVDLAVGVKRAEMITLRGHAPCDETLLDEECSFLQEYVREVSFQDEVIGLCESDSGAGIYKPAFPRPDKYGYWSVVGVVSGGPEDSACHDAALSVLAVQNSRVIVRLDAPKTRAWLQEVLAGDLEMADVSAEFNLLVAGGGGP